MQGRRITIRRFGDPDTLKPEPFDVEPPAAGEVQVEVRFIGINFADLLQRMGLYQAAPKRPFVPGFEVSGVVAAIGDGVKGVKLGQEVAAVSRFGAYTSHLNVPAENLFPIGDLSLEEAAAFPTVYLTAWEALVGLARARKGDKVLVHGGAGGVGLAAVTIAKHLGCEVYATAGSPEKVALLEREHGVVKAFDYRAGPWREPLLEAAGGRMDIVLETGGPERLKESMRATAPRGHIVIYGMQEVAPGNKRNIFAALKVLRGARLPLLSLVPRGISIGVFHLLYMWSRGVDLRASAQDILGLMGKGKIARPRVDQVFALDDAPAAHQYIHDRKNVGKVLLKV